MLSSRIRKPRTEAMSDGFNIYLIQAQLTAIIILLIAILYDLK